MGVAFNKQLENVELKGQLKSQEKETKMVKKQLAKQEIEKEKVQQEQLKDMVRWLHDFECYNNTLYIQKNIIKGQQKLVKSKDKAQAKMQQVSFT